MKHDDGSVTTIAEAQKRGDIKERVNIQVLRLPKKAQKHAKNLRGHVFNFAIWYHDTAIWSSSLTSTLFAFPPDTQIKIL